MHYRRAIVLAIVFLAASILPVRAQSFQPQPNTPLRSEILNAARPVFAAETNGPIEFVVRRLNFDDWAFGDVTLHRPGGDGSINEKISALIQNGDSPRHCLTTNFSILASL